MLARENTAKEINTKVISQSVVQESNFVEDILKFVLYFYIPVGPFNILLLNLDNVRYVN